MRRSISPATHLTARRALRAGICRSVATNAMLAAALLLLLAGGCQPPFETRYGRTSGSGLSSVNGTRVLADMFSDSGHKVDSRYQLSPKLMKADVIVWFPDDFDAPSTEVHQWLADWLRDAPDRTLIYVGRDFDAAPSYWKKLAGRVSADNQKTVARQQQEADAEFAKDRQAIPDEAKCDWFDISGKLDPREVYSVEGPWSEGIDAARVEIELKGRLTPVDWAESLLESDKDVLVGRLRQDNWHGSQFISVANGSFLLNEPLVNHENRKLAGRLIAAVGPPRKNVVFLQSGAGGPEVLDKEPEPPAFNSLEILGIWPLSGILLHLALLGVIFAFACWPIFGRPLVPPTPPASDFGKHVTALGQLLARTRDREFALARLAQWHRGRGTNAEIGTRKSEREEQDGAKR
jgi:hypothetical protein